MRTRQEWLWIIQRNNKRAIGQINQRLFIDMEETLEYLMSINDFLTMAISLTSAPRKTFYIRGKKLIAAVRGKFISLPPADADRVLQYLGENWNIQIASFFLLGTHRGDIPHAVQSMSIILDLFDRYLGIPGQAKKSLTIVLAVCELIRMSGNTGSCTWENVLVHSHNTRNISFLYRVVEMFASLFPTTFEIIPFSAWRPGDEPFVDSDNNTKTLRMPTPDYLVGWISGQIQTMLSSIERDQKQLTSTLINRLEVNFQLYSTRHEDRWLEMMIQPIHALRPNGLDSIDITVPQLAAVGYKRLILEPQQEFPSFTARYVRERYGFSHVVEMHLSPADLRQVGTAISNDTDPRVWVDRLLAYIAVYCVWRIVMGKEPEASGAGQSNGGGGGPAIVRPFFRKLPEGFRMSAEARERALATFQTEPQPGFTFVRGYRRGDEPHSGEPLWSLSEDDLTLPS